MQHPDEGMIHSWLDGALTPEEVVSMESHVATCPSCAAAVAEARGFIAASSRILTALDDVPRGVVPAVPARKRDLRVFWRAAAAMLVVAGGSLVVMREGGQDPAIRTTPTTEAATLSATAPAVSQDAAGKSAGSSPTRMDESTTNQLPPMVQAKPMRIPSTARGTARPGSLEQDLSKQSDLRRANEPASVVVGGTGTADAVVPARGTMQLQANVVLPEIEATPLKVLKVERTIGSRRTTYEVAPSQTVTLTEPEPVERSEVRMAAGRVAAQRQATTGSGARAAQPMAAEAASAPPPPAPMMDSRAGADSTSVRNEASSAAKTSPAAPSAAFVAVSNTISWRDSQTGKTLTLSGPFSAERLQEIRKRIEKERAAANKTVP